MPLGECSNSREYSYSRLLHVDGTIVGWLECFDKTNYTNFIELDQEKDPVVVRHSHKTISQNGAVQLTNGCLFYAHFCSWTFMIALSANFSPICFTYHYVRNFRYQF